jgi:SagB-type dehydrogenase family enzyme
VPVLALVPAHHGREANALLAGPVPVLDVVAAGTASAAWQRCLESAFASRLGMDGPTSVGIGSDEPAAVRTALLVVAADRDRRLDAAPQERWSPRAAQVDPAAPLLRAVLDRQLPLSLRTAATGGVHRVWAELAGTGPAPLLGVGWGLSRTEAAEAALAELLREATLDQLRPPLTSQGPPVEPPTANRPAPDERTSDERASDQPTSDQLTCDPSSSDPVVAIRARLHRQGVRAEVRLVHAEAGIVAVQARLRALAGVEPGVPERSAAARVRATGVGRLAPDQLNLAVPDEQVRLSRLYHHNSKLTTRFRDLPPVDLARMTPAAQTVIGGAVRQVAPGGPEHPLPRREPGRHSGSLEQTLRRRRSWAGMSGGPLTLAELGHLLDTAIGVTGSAGTPNSSVRLPLRATPASGGLYSTDVYVYVRQVDGVTPGVYYYDALGHRLQSVRAECDDAEVVEHIGYPPRAREASAVLVYVASFRRLQWKYWERAYRMAHLDCGHLAQNVILVATSMGLVAHPMIAFIDDYFDRLVGVNGEDEAVIHLTLLGRAATAAGPERNGP